jgi:5'-nucleotidase
MTEEPSILLTNDDGIDAPGIGVLADELVDLGEVTVVAPEEDQSGVGRRRSWDDVAIREHELGHAIDGTPVDCVVAGVVALATEFDIVVSGVNAGPNVGAHVLGRSGTVGAAIEAGFMGLPALAVSMYDPDELPPTDPDPGQFRTAVDATRFLLTAMLDGGVGELVGAPVVGRPEGPDYLNVNAPSGGADPPMRLTRPSRAYQLDGHVAGEVVELDDVFWEELRRGDVDDPVGTDRRAVADREVSVSALSAPRPSVDVSGQVVGGF